MPYGPFKPHSQMELGAMLKSVTTFAGPLLAAKLPLAAAERWALTRLCATVGLPDLCPPRTTSDKMPALHGECSLGVVAAVIASLAVAAQRTTQLPRRRMIRRIAVDYLREIH